MPFSNGDDMFRKFALVFMFMILAVPLLPVSTATAPAPNLPNEKIYLPAETFTMNWHKDGLIIECYTMGWGIAGTSYTMSVKALEPYGVAGGDIQLFYAENNYFYFFPDPYGGETIVSPSFAEFISYQSDFYSHAVERGGFWVQAKLLRGAESELVHVAILFVVVNP